jgi:hypothetical protein
MSGLQLLAVVGTMIAVVLSARLLFWAVRGLMDDPANGFLFLGYLAGNFFLAMCFVGVGGMVDSRVVAVLGFLVLISGMVGITYSVIEAIIKRRERQAVVVVD